MVQAVLLAVDAATSNRTCALQRHQTAANVPLRPDLPLIL
jgi:hypothetical protein